MNRWFSSSTNSIPAAAGKFIVPSYLRRFKLVSPHSTSIVLHVSVSRLDLPADVLAHIKKTESRRINSLGELVVESSLAKPIPENESKCLSTVHRVIHHAIAACKAEKEEEEITPKRKSQREKSHRKEVKQLRAKIEFTQDEKNYFRPSPGISRFGPTE